jgi:hypothetical protein
MAEAEPETEPTTDPELTPIMDAIVELMRSGVRPDVLEAQRLLLQRLATAGDVFPSRIPAPLNITEVGGYLNLLERAGQPDMRMSAVASALGVAGPPPASAALGGAVPVGTIDVPNDRPAGPVQPSIPPLLTIRADFHAPLLAARQALHDAGCLLPLRAPRVALPANQPGASATSVDMDAVFAALGRVLEVFPGTVLVDPAADALAIARPETPSTDPFRLVARELDGGTTVPEASWVAKRAGASSVMDDAPATVRYLDVAPLLQAAGWLHPEPLELPSSLTARGSLVRFVNLTGLIAGETTLGGDLELLYTPAAIARSALAAFTNHVWDGTAFVAP